MIFKLFLHAYFIENFAIKFLFDNNYLFLGNCLGTNYNDGTIQIEKEKTC
jgi:hypothetical protein